MSKKSSGGAGGDDGDAKPAEEEKPKVKDTFNLKLGNVDTKSKIKVIKEVRVIMELGLKEVRECRAVTIIANL